MALIAGLAFLYFRRRRLAATRQSASSALTTTPYTRTPDDAAEPKMSQNASSGPLPPFQPQRLYVNLFALYYSTCYSIFPPPQDPSDPSTFPTTPPVTNPSYVSVPYSPTPGSATFQGSNTHVAQHSMSSMPVTSPPPTGNYSGAPEI